MGQLDRTLVRDATLADAGAVAAIYNHYISHTVITFEENPVTAADMAGRIEEVQADRLPWLVAESTGQIRGYAYATRWRTRSAYRFSKEITVYLEPANVRDGMGTSLYAELFPRLRARGVHAAIGGIALPNDASVALHEKFGMKKVAHFSGVGFKLGRWVDVGYWQCLF